MHTTTTLCWFLSFSNNALLGKTVGSIWHVCCLGNMQLWYSALKTAQHYMPGCVLWQKSNFFWKKIDISCISDWDLSLHSLSSDRPCFFLFWYKMNTHGMSIVAGYFMTVFQAKTWYRITFNLKPHKFKIFRSWTYFMLPFVSEEYKAYFMAIMMMMMIDSRAGLW